jgi:hemerythrin-like domain-containing protein
MQARGPLMIEHRLIERMLTVVKRRLGETELTGVIDPLFVDTAVDFIRIYADRTHHGKEEDILFKKLEQKSLSGEDARIMKELIAEHGFGRETTRALSEANDRYREGEKKALGDVIACLRTLVDFYPRHIEKEDKVFFPVSRAYFSEEEDQAMLADFWDFDRIMIHEKYKSVVQDLE